ncbi:MAG TPA: molecular chaperone DnaK [Blastocatellia bacterium]|jgi:molecular chaperone DnaK|nr:molecular chaperone DnaK [Blastocatellia bacterium]
MGKVIGIDLGTTNSCVAILEGGVTQIVPNKEGGRTTPSVVAFTEKGERLIGQIAKRQAITNSANTIYAVKRLMGRKFDSLEVQRACQVCSYEITDAANGDCRVRVRGRDYSPPEISAILLQRLKLAAEEFLGDEVTEAIITVPAYFDDIQRQATKDAGKIAGLTVQRIINEPTAAALAYGLGKRDNERIAVYDLGGGTFDISIMEMADGVFEVLSTCGDSFLGGEDFDQRIVDWMIETFKQETGIDLRPDRLALQRLKEAAERAKCELSTTTESQLNLPFIAADPTGPKHFNKTLSRTKFEELVVDLVERTIEPCQKAIADAKLTPEAITKVLLVGGQTRSPIIISRVRDIFKREPSIEINPDEVVAIGAAIQVGVLAGDVKDLILLDVIPLSLGIETRGGLFTKLLDRNSTIPTKKSLVFTTVADNQQVVEVHVLQGERDIAAGNRSLARFELVGIPPAPRGLPQVEVTFEVDADGIVSVSARDKMTGLEQAMRITPSSGLSASEIYDLIEEANRNVESDRRMREIIISRNRLEGLLQNTVRSFGEFGWMLMSDDQEFVRNTIDHARETFRSEDSAEVRYTLEQLERAARLITDAMFRPTGLASGPGEKEREEDTTPLSEVL